MPGKEEYKRLDHERKERLFRGRNLYDKLRPLFDLPDHSPLPVRYKAEDLTLRPHLRDRIMEGEFNVQPDDKVYLMGFGEAQVPVQELFGSSQAVVEIKIFSGNDQTGNQGNITVRLKRNASEDSLFAGSLRPSGEIKGIWNNEYEAEQTLSLFAFAVKLIDSQRLRRPNTEV